MSQEFNETELVAAVIVNQCQQAFSQLVSKYQQPVRQYCRRLCAPDHSLADDVAQDTFFQAFKKMAQYEGKGKFQGWLFRIAYYQFLQIKRSEKPTESLDDEYQGGACSDKALLQRDLEAAMALISAPERTCLTLMYSFGYTQIEISDMLDMPLGTVKSHCTRGKKALSELLTPTSDNDKANVA